MMLYLGSTNNMASIDLSLSFTCWMLILCILISSHVEINAKLSILNKLALVKSTCLHSKTICPWLLYIHYHSYTGFVV